MMKCCWSLRYNGGCCAGYRIPRASPLASHCDSRPTIFTLGSGRSVIFSRTPERLQLIAEKRTKDNRKQKRQDGICRAALADDAPFALAIGASILATVVIPTRINRTEKKEENLLGADDVFSGAMQIISVVPFFNWLVWVFAYLDTRNPQYLAFTAVYLAPYLKTGLSLSPNDSWLPIASILACVAHVQLDLSVNIEGQSPVSTRAKVFQEKAQTNSEERPPRPDQTPKKTAISDGDRKRDAELNAILDEAEKKEFREWDEKLARSKLTEQDPNETDR